MKKLWQTKQLILIIGIMTLQACVDKPKPVALDLVLPEESSVDINETKVMVTIDKDMVYYVDEVVIAKEKLEQALSDRYDENENLTIILRLDEKVSIENAVSVMDLANKNNYKIVLAVRPN